MSRRLKIGCAVLVVVTALAVFIPLRYLRARVVEVEVEAVTRADINEVVSAVPVAGQPAGVVKPDEVKVIPKIGGELVRLLVQEGDRVSAGQVIAYLDARSVDADLRQARETAAAARARVAQAAAEAAVAPKRTAATMTEAQAALEQAEARYQTALRGARAEEIERARQAVRQAEQDLKEAEASLATTRRGARPEEIVAAEAALRQAEADLQSNQAHLELLLAGPRPEEVAQAEAAVRDARAQLEYRATTLASQRALAAKGFVSRNQLQADEAAHEAAQAAMQTAEQRLALVKEPYRPQELEQARAAVRRSEEAVRRARADLELLRHRTTPEDLAAAEARRTAAVSRLESARAALRLTEQQTTPEDLRVAAATVSQSRASTRRAEADGVSVRQRQLDLAIASADLRRAEAALQMAAERAGYTIITAPISGVVTRVNAKRGEYVQGGGIALPSAEIAMLVITATDRVWIECNVDEADVHDVRLGQAAIVFLGEGREVRGRVHQISPSVRLTQGDVRTFAVKLAVEGDTSALHSGMSVEVDIVTRSKKQALSVPSFAIFEDKDGKFYVYIMQNGRAKKKEVTKGVEGIERTEITKGLTLGESVITSLEAKGLRDGKPVRLAKEKKDEKATEEDATEPAVEVEADQAPE
ncbi:MAG: efflux RND transporter periplasmic adaptor subunit [Armatimonadetes bacterium]|nr:efflux RND transporter periplasmic adaptor subunit [Armatimonadota bacterium]